MERNKINKYKIEITQTEDSVSLNYWELDKENRSLSRIPTSVDGERLYSHAANIAREIAEESGKRLKLEDRIFHIRGPRLTSNR